MGSQMLLVLLGCSGGISAVLAVGFLVYYYRGRRALCARASKSVWERSEDSGRSKSITRIIDNSRVAALKYQSDLDQTTVDDGLQTRERQCYGYLRTLAMRCLRSFSAAFFFTATALQLWPEAKNLASACRFYLLSDFIVLSAFFIAIMMSHVFHQTVRIFGYKAKIAVEHSDLRKPRIGEKMANIKRGADFLETGGEEFSINMHVACLLSICGGLGMAAGMFIGLSLTSFFFVKVSVCFIPSSLILPALELGLHWRPLRACLVIMTAMVLGVPFGLGYAVYLQTVESRALVALASCGFLLYTSLVELLGEHSIFWRTLMENTVKLTQVSDTVEKRQKVPCGTHDSSVDVRYLELPEPAKYVPRKAASYSRLTGTGRIGRFKPEQYLGVDVRSAERWSAQINAKNHRRATNSRARESMDRVFVWAEQHSVDVNSADQRCPTDLSEVFDTNEHVYRAMSAAAGFLTASGLILL